MTTHHHIDQLEYATISFIKRNPDRVDNPCQRCKTSESDFMSTHCLACQSEETNLSERLGIEHFGFSYKHDFDCSDYNKVEGEH